MYRSQSIERDSLNSPYSSCGRMRKSGTRTTAALGILIPALHCTQTCIHTALTSNRPFTFRACSSLCRWLCVVFSSQIIRLPSVLLLPHSVRLIPQELFSYPRITMSHFARYYRRLLIFYLLKISAPRQCLFKWCSNLHVSPPSCSVSATSRVLLGREFDHSSPSHLSL